LLPPTVLLLANCFKKPNALGTLDEIVWKAKEHKQSARDKRIPLTIVRIESHHGQAQQKPHEVNPCGNCKISNGITVLALFIVTVKPERNGCMPLDLSALEHHRKPLVFQ
jgi:hypothetical protein